MGLLVGKDRLKGQCDGDGPMGRLHLKLGQYSLHFTSVTELHLHEAMLHTLTIWSYSSNHAKVSTNGCRRLAVEMGLLKCQGKTPEATMASALYTDVKRKLQKSLFTR